MSTTAERQGASMASANANGICPRWGVLARRRIFFGHQSVGRDIMGGVRALLAEWGGPAIRLVETDQPATVDGPAFMEARIGRNREPRSKMEAFERIVTGGLGAGGIALLKFCYVDVADDTDVDALYDEYLRSVARLEAVQDLVVVHATIPLRTAPPAMKERIGRLFGRRGGSALNLCRERYNERLRAGFPGKVFDIAALESTDASGRAVTRRIGGRSVPMLAPEWTHDGGHLNERGARMAARELLDVLSRVATPGSELSTVGGGEASANAARQ